MKQPTEFEALDKTMHDPMNVKHGEAKQERDAEKAAPKSECGEEPGGGIWGTDDTYPEQVIRTGITLS